jgi:outer membrane murein-binding lipoprotein Lpp
MPFKLDKQEIARRAKLQEELVELRGKLEDAVSTYNAAVSELQTPVNEALEKYNAAVEEARGFVFDIANQADSDINEKSEKWQEGDKGQAAMEWKDAWASEEFNEVEIEFPDELSLPDEEFDHDGRLENLPEAADA